MSRLLIVGGGAGGWQPQLGSGAGNGSPGL